MNRLVIGIIASGAATIVSRRAKKAIDERTCVQTGSMPWHMRHATEPDDLELIMTARPDLVRHLPNFRQP